MGVIRGDGGSSDAGVNDSRESIGERFSAKSRGLRLFRAILPPKFCVLHEFLATNRAALIEKCRVKVASRRAPHATSSELDYGIPLFLDQLIRTLQVEHTATPLEIRKSSEATEGRYSTSSEMGDTAGQHGLELLQHGFTVDQVVHDYGDLCQAITELAYEKSVTVQTVDFQTLNRCLDNAIADAVTEFAGGRETFLIDREVKSLNEQTGELGHELRNLLQTARYAFVLLKRGKVGPDGATGGVLERSLEGMSVLIDHALADVRVTARIPLHTKRIALSELIAQIGIAASIGAHARECEFRVSAVEPFLAVEVDLQSMMAAVTNLLQNAFKFSHPHSTVTLEAYAESDRVRIDVKDQCGGLPTGFVEAMFLPFSQGSTDKSGMGLGLAIARRIIEAHSGTLCVRDVPGVGCIFTIDLPRHSLPRVLDQATPAHLNSR